MRLSLPSLAMLICFGLLAEPALAKSDAYQAGKVFGSVLMIVLVIGALVLVARFIRSKT